MMEVMQDKDGNTIVYNGDGNIKRYVKDRLNGTTPELITNLSKMSDLADQIEYSRFGIEINRDRSGIVITKGYNRCDAEDLFDRIEKAVKPLVEEFNREIRIEKVNEYNDLFEKINQL